MLIDDDEALEDMAVFLKNEFQDIRWKYYDQLDESWPPEAHVRHITTSASGHFAFASTITKYVGDENQADPRGQLDRCIRFLDGIQIAGALNPFQALDLLYRQILLSGPKDTFPTTMRILGLHILYPDTQLTAYWHANFLDLDQATFYRSLQHLHSVIEIPPLKNAHTHCLRFYHASFSDFLSDSHRSEPFTIDKPAVHYDVAIHSLKWQNYRQIKGGSSSDHTSATHLLPKDPKLQWLHSEVTEYATLRRYSSVVGWKACCSVSDEDIPRVVAELERFEFKNMHMKPMHFGEFLAWLYKLVHSFSIPK